MDQLITTLAGIASLPPALYATLFTAAAASAFFPPVPIEAGMVFAGFLVSRGHASLPAVVIPVVAGISLGSIAVFELARRFGSVYFERAVFTRLMPPALYLRTLSVVRRYGVWALFVAKAVPGMYFCALVCVGLFRMGTGAAYAGIIASNSIAVTVLACIGYLAGEHWHSAFLRIGALAAGAAGLLLAGFVFTQWIQSRKK